MSQFFPAAHPALGKISLPFLLTVLAALTKFFFYCFCIFLQTIRLIQKHKTVLFRKIIQERNSTLFDRLLYSRIDGNFIKIFQRTLTLRIKCTDGVNLISPEFNSPRIFFCERIDIHNPTSNRKLSGHLNLTHTLISHMNKCILELIHIQCTVISEMNQLFFNFIKRLKIIHASIYTGDNCNILFLLQQCLNNAHPLAYQNISMNIRLKKKQILCRVIIYILIIKTIIFIQLFRSFLIFCQNQMRWKKPGKPIYKMSFLGLHTTTDLQYSTIIFCLSAYCFHLCKILQRTQKCFHTTSSFLLYSFMAASGPSDRISSTALHARSCASSTSLRSSFPNLPRT